MTASKVNGELYLADATKSVDDKDLAPLALLGEFQSLWKEALFDLSCVADSINKVF